MNNNKKYVIGNWKSNKNTLETESWFKTFFDLYSKSKNLSLGNIEIVICAPFILLPFAKNFLDNHKLPLKLGAQDVSPFQNGAYTGEVSAAQIGEFAEYVIIGHSERRNNFSENDKLLSDKVKRANEAKLMSVYCVQDQMTEVASGVGIVAYEPIWAIGTGKTDTPENADKVAEVIKKRWQADVLLYGGSVTPDNIMNFISTKHIDGVLVGGASLDPNKFWEMIVNAVSF